MKKILLTTTAALVLSACGGSDDGETSTAPDPVPPTVSDDGDPDAQPVQDQNGEDELPVGGSGRPSESEDAVGPTEQEPSDEPVGEGFPQEPLEDPAEAEGPTGQEPPDEPAEEESTPEDPVEEVPEGEDPVDEGDPVDEQNPPADSSGSGQPIEGSEPVKEPLQEGSGLPSEARTRLETLFELANGDVFVPMLDFLERLDAGDSDDAERAPISAAPDPDFPQAGDREVFACPDGGTFAVASGSLSGSGPFSSTIFEGCAADGTTVDGSFLESSAIDATGGPSSLDVTVRDYRLVDGSGGVTTMSSGEIVSREPAAQDGGEYVPVRWIARELSIATDTREYSAANQVTTYPQDVSPDETVTFGLEVTIEGLGGSGFSDATVRTVTPFRPAEQGGRLATGSLTITDANRVETVDADGGDPMTFLYTIEEGGATESYPVERSSTYGFGRPDLNVVGDAP